MLIGGQGNDTLNGGLGADRFSFNTRTGGADLIQDFNQSEGDKIEIVKSRFGATSLSQFTYDITTGALSFDASPFDRIAAVQFATLAAERGGAAFSPQLDIVLI